MSRRLFDILLIQILIAMLLDISFLVGADKANAEYAINEAVIDIQEIEGLVDEDEEEVLVFESWFLLKF